MCSAAYRTQNIPTSCFTPERQESKEEERRRLIFRGKVHLSFDKGNGGEEESSSNKSNSTTATWTTDAIKVCHNRVAGCRRM